MAELVDARVSEARGSNLVMVRFHSSAPNIRDEGLNGLCPFFIMPDELLTAIKTHEAAFGLSLSDNQIARLKQFYSIIQEHNQILHLVGPMSPEEFVVRHILESLTMLEYMPENTRFADIGAGAGLPSIPCLLVRENLRAVLIESKVRKANYLVKAVSDLGIADRAQIVNLQFEEASPVGVSVIACRALDKFTQKLPKLLKWSHGRTLLLFGGPALHDAFASQKIQFEQKLLPMSEQRYLFVVRHLHPAI